MTVLIALIIATALVPGKGRGNDNHVKLIPDLRVGQVLRYEILGRVEQATKTKSPVTKYTAPRDVKQEFSAALRVVINKVGLENGKAVINANSEFEYPADNGVSTASPQRHSVSFTLDENGQVKSAAGLDDLDAVERIAWQFWVSQFAFGWTITARNVKPGEAWKSEEQVNSPSPIARVFWERVTTVGDSSKCAIAEKERCTAFLTTALLKQKSSPADSTPEDYRLHDLKTSGSVSGKNETYDSISETTGLLMRGTEDVKQSMEVMIAKADASNSVHYTMEAGSHFEMVLVVDGAAGK
jgi:hypothetical protein